MKYVSTEQFTNDFINSIASKDTSASTASGGSTGRTTCCSSTTSSSSPARRGRRRSSSTRSTRCSRPASRSCCPPTGRRRTSPRSRSGCAAVSRWASSPTSSRRTSRPASPSSSARSRSRTSRVPDEVLTFIADRVSSQHPRARGRAHPRRRVQLAHASQVIDLELAQQRPQGHLPRALHQARSRSRTIQQEVCKFYGISQDGPRRQQALAERSSIRGRSPCTWRGS